MDGWHYAAGWEVNTEQAAIRHAGGNPTFITNVVLFPQEQVGIALLSNSSGTYFAITDNIKDILAGSYPQAYQIGFMKMLDIIFSCITIIAGLSAAALLLLGLRRKKMNSKLLLTKKRLALIAVWLFIFIAFSISCLGAIQRHNSINCIAAIKCEQYLVCIYLSS